MRAVYRSVVTLVGAGIVIGGLFAASADAMEFNSSDYIIDAATLNNVGGFSGSSNYQLTSSGGETSIGDGSSGSYKLAAGYVAQIIEPQMTVQTQPSGLVAYYPLDEGSGTVAHDNSANDFDGEFMNGPTWASGKIGQAVDFLGSSKTAIDLGNSAQLQAGTLTIEAWINTNYSAKGMMVVGKQDAWTLNISYDVGLHAIVDSPNGDTCNGTTDVTDGAWHQLVAVIQDGVASGTKLYVDGALEGSCSTGISNQASDVLIGGLGSFINDPFTGEIDQVKIFDRVLSADEITAEYKAQNAGVPTGLSLQTIVPGASNTSDFETIVKSSGSSYSLAINQNHDLQNGSNTIPAIGSVIASPGTWNEGTTKGLGFSVVSSTATAPSASWSAGSSFAALPDTATAFYTSTGLQSNAKDVIGLRLRADVVGDQAGGDYTNQMTITGTASP